MTDQVEIIVESLKRRNVSFSGTFSLVLPLSDRKVPDTRVTLPFVNTVNRHLQQANLFYVSGCICQSWTTFACCFIYSWQERSVHNLNFIFQWQEVRDLVIGNVTSHRSLFFYPLCNTFYRKKKVFFQRPSCRKQQSK